MIAVTVSIVSIFVGALLSFQIQPLLGKILLAQFGGGPAVWATCLFFFQTILLFAYFYVHFITTKFSEALWVFVHGFVLCLSLVLFLLQSPEISLFELADPNGPNPIITVYFLLLGRVGLPLFLLFSASPLLQKLIDGNRPNFSVYRFYALSNFGSLFGLLVYPFVIEPKLDLDEQLRYWSAFYLIFLLLGLMSLIAGFRRLVLKDLQLKNGNLVSSELNLTMMKCLLLSACGSALLLSTTNQMTQFVAPIPLIWILPLSLYLLSFVICFESERLYNRNLWSIIYLTSFFLVVYALNKGDELDLFIQLAIYCSALLSACIFCHGELVKIKPDTGQLTEFYLFVALGGAMGSAFVVGMAPIIFNDFLEYHLFLFFVFLLVIYCFYQNYYSHISKKGAFLKNSVVATFTLFALSILLNNIVTVNEHVLVKERNFYGVLSVEENRNEFAGDQLLLKSGVTLQGLQSLDPTEIDLATSYYSSESGLAHAFSYLRELKKGESLSVAAIGLGVGTIAVYGKEGDYIRYYEINPIVEEFANEHFSFLENSKANFDIVLGDARISLQKDQLLPNKKLFDLIVVDAFNSDTVPTHLLTKEAVALYKESLSNNGVLAFHVSTDYLDLAPVARAATESNDLYPLYFRNLDKLHLFIWASEWVLASEASSFQVDAFPANTAEFWSENDKSILWTDKFSSLFDVI